jgi:hypothetical protein
LGVCHKTIIQQNGYDFYFEGTGHGMYMISANGGSWSHIDPLNEQYCQGIFLNYFRLSNFLRVI